MEEVIIAQVNLGDTPPLVHRVSQPLLDERGTWIDADVTYEGLMHMTITTKLNLLRLKRQQQHATSAAAAAAPSTVSPTSAASSIVTGSSTMSTLSVSSATAAGATTTTVTTAGIGSGDPLRTTPVSESSAIGYAVPPPAFTAHSGDAIYDSNAESSGASSSESESPSQANTDALTEYVYTSMCFG